jgi:hypothetical protein
MLYNRDTSFNLLSKYPNLNVGKIGLADLGVDYTVFSNWKQKGVFDYEQTFSEEDKARNLSRKRVTLNVFEAIWVLMIKELRDLNVGLKTIKEFKAYLFTKTDFSSIQGVDKDELNLIIEHMFDEASRPFIKKLVPDFEKFVEVFAEQNTGFDFYFTPMSRIVYAVLIDGHAPTVQVLKKPLQSEVEIRIFDFIHINKMNTAMGEDVLAEYTNTISNQTIINIPIRPLFGFLLESETLQKHALTYKWYTPQELEVLKHIQEDDYDSITIYKDQDEQFTLKKESTKQVKNEAARTIRKALGMNDYKRAVVMKRNEKHLVVKNTKQIKIK